MSSRRPEPTFAMRARSFNCDGRYGAALLACLAVIALLTAGGDTARQALRLERSAVPSGELWRLLSGHFVHLDGAHAALNAAGLGLLWTWFAREFPPRLWLIVALASMLAIDIGLAFRNPEISSYAGLSGVLHGLAAAGALSQARRGELRSRVLLALLAAKLGYEQWSGALPFSGMTTLVVVDAHLYGAVGGLLAALALRAWRLPL